MSWNQFSSFSLAIYKVPFKLIIFSLLENETIKKALFEGTFVIGSIESDFAL